MSSSSLSTGHGGRKPLLKILMYVYMFGLSGVALWYNLRHGPQASNEHRHANISRKLHPLQRVNHSKYMRLASKPNTTTHVVDSSRTEHHTAPLELDANNNNTESDFFSACLLTKDDSHFLIEWLAYHYHTLPLRHLIVAVDPDSKTTPSPIFAKWRQHGDMRIDEWTDTDFMKTSKVNRTNTQVHRTRQSAFYRHCLRELKNANRTYTILIDVDEYLSFNTHTKNISISLETPGAFLPFLKQEMQKDKNSSLLHSHNPCIMMPRLRYGSVESTPEQVSNGVPVGFNGTAFQTLRYRKYGPPKRKHLYGPGKTIIDVSRVEHMDGTNPHRPVRKCTKEIFLKPDKSPFIVRHYLGSMEQFLFRDDARQAKHVGKKEGMKSTKTYDKIKDLNYGADDAIRPWIKGFVDDVGYDKAMELLKGVGDVSIAPPMPK